MKKLLFLGLSVLTAALPAGAENKIQMVTYFPVPYVAYSQINPTKQLDVGLSSACEMNLGCQESGEAGLYPLQVTTELLLNKGRLDFNTAAAVYSASAAIGNGYGVAHLDFSDSLRLTTLTNGYTMEANQMTVDTLNLFPDQIKNSFPSCAAVSGSTNISWQNLKLNKDTETYLMCGNAADVKNPCEGQVKSQWDGTRCVCPTGSYYVAASNACCNDSSPTSDSKCWNTGYIWGDITDEVKINSYSVNCTTLLAQQGGGRLCTVDDYRDCSASQVNEKCFACDTTSAPNGQWTRYKWKSCKAYSEKRWNTSVTY